MSTNNRKYATPEQVKLYLAISQNVDDILLEEIIDRATKIIETHTQRIFSSTATYSKYFDAREDVDHRGRVLWLNENDLCEIEYVKNGDLTTVASTEYVTNPRNETPFYSIKLKENSSIVWLWNTTPENAIEVKGHWAYSITPPLDIVQSCIRLSAFLYKQKDNTSDIDRPFTSGDGTVIMPIELPKDIKNLLLPYKRLV